MKRIVEVRDTKTSCKVLHETTAFRPYHTAGQNRSATRWDAHRKEDDSGCMATACQWAPVVQEMQLTLDHITPVIKWFVSHIYKPFRTFGRGTTMVMNHLLTGMILQVVGLPEIHKIWAWRNRHENSLKWKFHTNTTFRWPNPNKYIDPPEIEHKYPKFWYKHNLKGGTYSKLSFLVCNNGWVLFKTPVWGEDDVALNFHMFLAATGNF